MVEVDMSQGALTGFKPDQAMKEIALWATYDVNEAKNE